MGSKELAAQGPLAKLVDLGWAASVDTEGLRYLRTRSLRYAGDSLLPSTCSSCAASSCPLAYGTQVTGSWSSLAAGRIEVVRWWREVDGWDAGSQAVTA